MRRRRTEEKTDHLSIVISGPPQSGRSTVATIISEALRAAGATVTLVDDDVVPAARFGPLTGKQIRIDVRKVVKGHANLRLIKQ